ncbi:acyltransferase [Chloroflexus aggregans]|jgi:acetyltransferase-like isoleucine patch superfamily enzyme|uniref:Transferase hexapeptide repeat containing protein n=1 Tax=Chloroflexus aggregans (strain MD-66 / DSM 9485) TaxID=326427 RepID=B8G5M9_CHLAD|nr:acyltransferase [Chloroflexus aggregans]ACL23740.1 transferase hexapeptide repeat containing protein [Chloroflexus aggregans DSM 9485]RME30566.1 MAG: acyltransferase [Candidatus Parcubacteria bacterium]GIV86236.1 MAG: transferase [Chloroflexus sp.]
MTERLQLYLSRQASSLPRYMIEQTVQSVCGWIPGLIGIGLRAFIYRAIMHIDGIVAIEDGVRIRFADNVRLGSGVYLDHGVYLHACPGGISIGAESMVMKNAILHVYNFRQLPHSHISIGRRSLIGEGCILRGQGGITIGDDVYLGTLVQILAVNHVFHDTTRPISTQGITAQGIRIGDGSWIGSGAIILDGVNIGKNVVVGAGAVVTKDIPDYCVAVGNPARVVRDLHTDPLPLKQAGVPVY